MKTLKIFILAAFAAAFTSACQTVDVTPEPSSEKVLMTFSVTADNSDETRTFLASNGQSVRWKNTDELAVWDGTQVCKFSIPETVEDFSGAVDFTGHAVDGQEAYYALYPYAAEGLTFTTSDDDDPYVTGVTFPEVQTATKGSYDPKAVVSVAVSTDKTFEMRNAVALAKVSIKSADIESVQITAADNETNAKAYLAGVAKVVIKEYPAVYAQSSQSKSVTLTSETVMEPGDYYIAMMPRTLAGLSVTYTKADGSVATVSSVASVNFKRATITDLGIDDSSLTFTKEEEPVEPKTLTLTIDFTVGRDKVFTGYIPNSNTSEQGFTFIQDGEEYPFNISSSQNFKYTDSSLMLNVGGSSDGSISLPAISGMKLSTVRIECAEVTAKTPIYVYSEKGLAGTKMEGVNMNANTSAKTLTLSDNTEEGTIPQLNTSYYFAVKAKAFKLKKLIITYTE